MPIGVLSTHHDHNSIPSVIILWILHTYIINSTLRPILCEVGLHHGSALSPYLFLLLMDVLTEDVRNDVSGSMMFADGIVLCGYDQVDMTEYLETWRRSLEDRRMRISRPNTQFIDFKFGPDNGQGREPVKIIGEELQRVHHFKYLSSSVGETVEEACQQILHRE